MCRYANESHFHKIISVFETEVIGGKQKLGSTESHSKILQGQDRVRMEAQEDHTLKWRTWTDFCAEDYNVTLVLSHGTHASALALGLCCF